MKKRRKKRKEFNRYAAFLICMAFIFTAIISKLCFLQIRDVDHYKELADKNSHKLVLTAAPRGEIYDKNGEVLATSKQSFMLTFTETDESKEKFYGTIGKVMKLLDENGEKLEDDFQLKVDPYRLDLTGVNELRFKKDRGLDEYVMRKLFPQKKMDELTDNQKKQIDEELLKITPEEMFNKLIEDYTLYDMVKGEYINEKWNSLNEDDKKNLNEETWKEKEGKNWDDFDEKVKINYLHEKRDLKTIRSYMIIKDKIKMQSFSGYKPVIIANDIKENSAFVFEQLQAELPGITISKQPIREYPNGELASAVLGYMRKISPSEQNKYEEKGYDTSIDYIGAAGVEGVFESVLKGTKGQESIEINKSGRKVKSLGEQVAYPGNNITLTIDKDVQEIAEKALDDTMVALRERRNRRADGSISDTNTQNATRGASVVLDVNTGAVLALVSKPGYDPNLFTVPGRLTEEEYSKYFNPDLEAFGRDYIRRSGLLYLSTYREKSIGGMTSKQKEDYILNDLFPIDTSIEGNTTIRQDKYDIYPKPFYNYATKSLVPPGSVFKPLTSIAGLEEGVINANTTVYDSGYYNKRYKQYHGASWKFNLNGGSHGSQNVIQALADSNNFFMYEIADRLFVKGGIETKQGLDMIAKYAWQYGLGADPSADPKYSTGIEIPENFGQVYNYESSKRSFSILYTQNIYEFLDKGNASIWGIEYKGIDIVPKVDDPDNVKTIKQDLTKAIKEEIMNPTDPTSFGKKIQDMLKNLINTSQELKSVGYTDNDIKGMVEAIQSSVRDAQEEIKSGTNLYNASIGQGLNQFTPVQLASYMATMVNGGKRYKVHLVDKITDADGNVVKDYSDPEVLGTANVSQSTIDIVKQGMLDVIQDGTGASFFKGFPIKNGGKTSTSTFNVHELDMGRSSYAVFGGFAPFDKPEIAVVTMIFDGGGGNGEAVRPIYEEYFRDEIKAINPNYKFKYESPKEKREKEKADKEKAEQESKQKNAATQNDQNNQNVNQQNNNQEVDKAKPKDTGGN